MLIAELPKSLSTMQDCLDRNDRNRLKSVSHKLKGGSAYCRAPALHEAARALDQAALTASVRHVDYLLQRLKGEADAMPGLSQDPNAAGANGAARHPG